MNKEHKEQEEHKEQDEQDEREEKEEKPSFVYLLATHDGKKTYVGATMDLDRRLRQHNGEIKGGAHATSLVPAGWYRVCHVEGFPTWRSALQFEWRWKQLTRQIQFDYTTPLARRRDALDMLLEMDRATKAAIPYSQWPSGGPKLVIMPTPTLFYTTT